MSANRVIEALRELGGKGTTQDVTRVLRARPESISSQISSLCARGAVVAAGKRAVCVKRWQSYRTIEATVWQLTDRS